MTTISMKTNRQFQQSILVCKMHLKIRFRSENCSRKPKVLLNFEALDASHLPQFSSIKLKNYYCHCYCYVLSFNSFYCIFFLLFRSNLYSSLFRFFSFFAFAAVSYSSALLFKWILFYNLHTAKRVWRQKKRLNRCELAPCVTTSTSFCRFSLYCLHFFHFYWMHMLLLFEKI